MNFTSLTPAHADSINDISFDYYGNRVATCSSDGTVKVWTLNQETGAWFSVDLKGHRDIVWRISWAHPEFGQIVASCSDDGFVKIWEEVDQEVQENSKWSKSNWQQRAQISVDTKKPIKDVKFSQKDLGLKLALAGSDGYIYFYNAADIFDLSSWEMLVRIFFFFLNS
jgi:nucleoporin SEH1